MFKPGSDCLCLPVYNLLERFDRCGFQFIFMALGLIAVEGKKCGDQCRLDEDDREDRRADEFS